MYNHEIGIRKFIKTPWAAVRAGYKPSYLDCVSVAADSGIKLVIEGAVEHFGMLKHFLSLTVIEVIRWILWTPIVVAMVIASPALIWPAGWVMFKNSRKEK